MQWNALIQIGMNAEIFNLKQAVFTSQYRMLFKHLDSFIGMT